MQKAVDYIKEKYPDIRRNVLTGEIEKAPDIDSMFVELKLSAGSNINKEVLKSYYNSTFINDYDPIKEYFEGLTDGSGHIENLFLHLNIVGTLTEKEFYYDLFKKHLIGCVAQGLGEAVHRQILILQGTKQNIGKTWFIRFLIPEKLKRYATDNLDEKDEHLFLTMFWIINIDELDNFNNKDIEKIKSLVSSDVHNYRKLYSQTFARKQRRAAFFGSTNKTEFLKDSENTRWINIPVDSIKYDYTNTIDINNVWGEAYHLYKSGVVFHLTKNETDFLNKLNDNFKYLSDYDHYVRDYAVHSDSEDCLTTATEFSECISYLLNIAKPDPGRMGRALQANGFNQVYINRSRKYKIQMKLDDDIKTVKQVLTTLKNRKEQYAFN